MTSFSFVALAELKKQYEKKCGALLPLEGNSMIQDDVKSRHTLWNVTLDVTAGAWLRCLLFPIVVGATCILVLTFVRIVLGSNARTYFHFGHFIVKGVEAALCLLAVVKEGCRT